MKKCLIVGGAGCVFDDVEKALQLFTPDIVIAINDVVSEIEQVTDFATMHPEKTQAWLGYRRHKLWPEPNTLWTAQHKTIHSPYKFERVASRGGSSGLLAVRVAAFLRANAVVLAGVPMEKELGHYKRKAAWHDCNHYRQMWEHEPVLKVLNIRSMSGWTMKKFQYPTKEWFEQLEKRERVAVD